MVSKMDIPVRPVMLLITWCNCRFEKEVKEIGRWSRFNIFGADRKIATTVRFKH